MNTLIDQVTGHDYFDLPLLDTPDPYQIKRLCAQPYEMVRVPFYYLHRGITNEESLHRTVFFICSTHDFNFDLDDFQKTSVVVSEEDNPK